MVLIACGQLCSTSSLAENAQKAVRLITRAAAMNAKVLFLPEASDYLAVNAKHSVEIVRLVQDSPFIQGVQKTLRELHSQGKSLHVSVGVHEPCVGGDRVKNTLLWINDQGVIEQRYQKLHLFDISIPNGPILKESNSVERGNEIIPPFDTPAGKLGMGICYDIRFPELALRLRSLGAQILTYPSAFTMKTGAAHWHLLARARAIDTQSYVVMAAQAGTHKLESEGNEGPKTARISYGHALIVDPWGTVVAECSDVDVGDEDLCVADIDLVKLEKVRKDMPLWEHRRPDAFGYEV
ncbi:hypothetical protein BABINDRAFT_163337 [Babjeviella inositovora NRRL Y-12698]|uniref:CN hydrolase domain-containing protein n=1 Tax=Babjeviella inositovora NRRL Y-12698 TaxID=984486 RepID=A0A1E3QIY1_9ASCO|nr:uncharacterized protein BABINDRAFT_163337 [Babjeviella inositovora NRRL Y-12698]ODQ77610.1 hypothetical protein BABINDRAFT_163337 [Babjeviella inositovora NRRL Y-12698]